MDPDPEFVFSPDPDCYKGEILDPKISKTFLVSCNSLAGCGSGYQGVVGPDPDPEFVYSPDSNCSKGEEPDQKISKTFVVLAIR